MTLINTLKDDLRRKDAAVTRDILLELIQADQYVGDIGYDPDDSVRADDGDTRNGARVSLALT